MIIEQLEQQKIVCNAFWPPLELADNQQHLTYVVKNAMRQNRTVAYVTTDAEGNMMTHAGYFKYQPLVYEPLAMYVRALFGDGFYYGRKEDENIWLLIVADGLIVPGTDIIINHALFELLLKNKQSSQYKELPLCELNEQHQEAILSAYHANQKRLRKKRRLIISVFLFVTAIIMIAPFIFILG